jgi:hypothetical protein
MIHTHPTAPTQFVEASGIRFAYRRFGKTGGVPLVFSHLLLALRMGALCSNDPICAHHTPGTSME